MMTTITAISISLMTTIMMTESIITLGSILVTGALTSTLVMSYIIGSWFALILFLIYITGMLVMFSYMLATSPNNLYSKMTNSKKFILYTTILLTTMMTTNPIMKLTPLTPSNNFEKGVIQLYSKTSLFMYRFIALILLTALLITVSLCYKSPKPLRPFIS